MSTYKVEKSLKGLEESLTEFTVIENERVEPETCGGLFFRVAREAWISPTSGDVNFRYRFRPLPSKSCTGCYTCEWLHEDFQENLYNNKGEDIQLEQYFTHGMLVQLKVTHVSTDWETGIVDDYEIDFVEVKE